MFGNQYLGGNDMVKNKFIELDINETIGINGGSKYLDNLSKTLVGTAILLFSLGFLKGCAETQRNDK